MAMKRSDPVNTALLVAIVGVVGTALGTVLTAVVQWVLGRGKEKSDVQVSHVRASGDVVAQFQALLDQKTEYLEGKIADQDGKIAELSTALDDLRGELVAVRSERAAAEALALEIDAELRVANQHIEVLASLLDHHGIERPIRPTPSGDTS